MQTLQCGERLVAGEVRTIAISLSAAPASATVTVLRQSTGSTLVATTAATVNGVVVSYLLTMPSNLGADNLRVVFLCVVGAETIGVAVDVPIG